ncbi:hypothetical protein BV25DRAFT_1921863 [Artomyces pyxidatus]|uniref:Uncharacterized protein n=1 Tax=Artomyces pyxidatus TaxID=48021 RepID=A0ACB8SFQ4_9AGAM|nr:hypothetical protein BV25DRAFT_1921863 [Artomyces pyxidatus]
MDPPQQLSREFPRDVWLCVLNNLPIGDIPAFRLVCRAFRDVGQLAALRSIVCRGVPKHVMELAESLKEDSPVRACMETFTFRDWTRCGFVGRRTDVLGHFDSTRYVGTYLCSIIALFPSVPKLRSLSFHFDLSNTAQDIQNDRRRFQTLILNTLATLPTLPYLTRLEITGLLPYHHGSWRVFSAFQKLETLQLTVRHLSPAPWLGSLLASLLKPPVATLTSLDIHFASYVGNPEGVRLSDITFPCLTNLSLKSVLLGGDTFVEPFIIAHISTLRSLSMTACGIVCGFNTHQSPEGRNWELFFDALDVGMVALTVLDITGYCYAVFDATAQVWTQIEVRPSWKRRDAAALERLQLNIQPVVIGQQVAELAL